jgi:small subunit ribosomal protein S16
MAVKIRLARKGRKKKAFFHIVVADSRSPRDGRYIEKIGFYNPITNPATIEIDFDKALGWLQNGAIPTETCRAILSYKGVLLKKHLLEGVKKGAFDEAEATRRFEEWMKQNEAKIEAKKSGLEKSKDEELVKRLASEKRINEARAAKLAKKQTELADKEKQAATADETEEGTTRTEEPVQVKDEVTVAEEQVPAEEPETAKENKETPAEGEDESKPEAEEDKPAQ